MKHNYGQEVSIFDVLLVNLEGYLYLQHPLKLNVSL